MLRLLERLRDEQDGNVLVIAVTMVALMLVVGSSALSVVDTQTEVSTEERQHESSFNLAEGVLNAQAFVLGRLGTGGVGTSEFPTECTNTATALLCPDPEQVERSYNGATLVDYRDEVAWRTRVRDNPNGAYYDSAAVDAAPRYDANGDRQLWVAAEATVRDRTRTIVALIRVEDRPVSFPRYGILAGAFATSNNGRKTIVDVNHPTSLGLAVRCVEAGFPDRNSSCLGYDHDKDQLFPKESYVTGMPDTPAIAPDDLAALEEFARGSGTYFESCTGADPNGAVVVIAAGSCSFNNSAPAAPGQGRCCNSTTSPGLLIVKCGSVSFGGNIEFNGIVYVPNKASPTDTTYCSSGNVVTTSGTALIRGGVIIDGPGRMYAGSSKENVIFDPLPFDNVKAAGTAGIVQNTWREIPDDN